MCPITAWGGPLVIGEGDSAALAGHMEAFEDRSGQMTAEDVMRSAVFRPIPGAFSAGYTKSAWWLRVRVIPEAGAQGPWYLAINAPYTDHIETFAPDMTADGGTAPARKATGASCP